MSDIPADWLARYVTRTGIVIHPMILKDIEQRRGIPYPDSLLTYFSENRDGDDWKRISNAWRQKRFRDQRSNTLEALRNGIDPAELAEGIRQEDFAYLLDTIISTHNPEGFQIDSVDRCDSALDILQALRNAIDLEMDYLNKHKQYLAEQAWLRNTKIKRR